jgi:hypothetical protein
VQEAGWRAAEAAMQLHSTNKAEALSCKPHCFSV